jgi:hypothetical protein
MSLNDNQNATDVEGYHVNNEDYVYPNMTSDFPPFINIENLRPEQFFEHSVKDLMNSYLESNKLKPKLLEYLMKYAVMKNITRKESGKKFYEDNLEILIKFSKLKTNTKEEKNYMLKYGETIVSRFYPEIKIKLNKVNIIGLFYLTVESTFKG